MSEEALYGCCDCAKGSCVACPYSNACPRCEVKQGARCRRPSGHGGPLIQPHSDRVLLADIDAIADHPDMVRQAIEEALGEPSAREAWLTNLHELRAHLTRKRGRVRVGDVDALIQLAESVTPAVPV